MPYNSVQSIRGVVQMEERRAHNSEVAGSSPVPTIAGLHDSIW